MSNYFLQTYTWNPWQNLAVEKYLESRIQKGDVMLYLWQNDHTVVIGKNQNALRECKAQLLEEEGGFLARRTTGGGAVYHDLGNLCFTFLADPELYDVPRQLQVIQHACRKFSIDTVLSGRNDVLTKEGFKFSGNAFSKTSACNIQHGTLMIDVNKDMLGRYLTPSQEKLKSKGVKSVQSRVCNLTELNPSVTTDAMRQALKESFEELYGTFTELDPTILDNETVRETFDLYASWGWRYGKSPACETSFCKRFDWGEVEVHLKLTSLHISEIHVFSDALDTELPGQLETLLFGKCYDVREAKEALDNYPEPEQQAKMLQVLEWLSSCFTE